MSRRFRMSLLILSILGIPVFLYFSGVNFLVSPVGAALSILFSVLYLALVLWLLSRSPMWPQRAGAGALWVAASLLWGGGVSFLLVMLGGLPILEITDRLGLQLISASLGGAYPEEIAKALGVGVILFSFRALNRPWHGLMTGAVIGLGFEVTENAMYGAFGALLDPNTDLAGTLEIWAVRLFVGPGLHIIFSALAGWGLGLALFTADRSRSWRLRTAGLWLLIAFGLHFAWNLLPPDYWMMIVNYIVVALVMYPLFVWVWITAHKAAKDDDSYAYTPVPLTSFGQLERA
ncbi:PrsW family intramembrane metalloprotease [Corynebacterium sp. YIM 101645]|uniref:PrsW family intramembrane metalloprotease n=1 Tax=Corynebacterium lemuris TaxID=1859292 RepID=A0ABT2FSM4_9CORY|nr:PrsW family intramembrane metalloprotease [Corynebacterium lemuris]MCS5478206.1 PrsW family intramembrane metalloprotease [Corynebacterium lemuris]